MTIQMTKLKNRISRIHPGLDVTLRNVSVNGVKQGCSGFVTDPATQNTVYVNTDINHGHSAENALYRTARDTKDYRGGRNRRVAYDADMVAHAVVDLLLDMNEGRAQYDPI